MSDTYLEIEGEIISAKDVRIPKAREVLRAVEAIPYTKLVECRRTVKDTEIVIFDAEVEQGQSKVHDIHRFERIAVEFDIADNSAPEILALRPDFPKVPHLNIRDKELPRSLCVFEEEYTNLKLYWTGLFFVERIREWLALTAKGKLHADDQPLEPLLPDLGWQLILPSDMFSKSADAEILTVQNVIDSGLDRKTLIAKRATNLEGQQNPIKFITLLIYCKPQAHGIIYAVPRNIAELDEFLKNGEVDLLNSLRKSLSPLNTKNTNLMDASLILVVVLPKTREGNVSPEAYEYRAFMVNNTVREIGIDLGIWGVIDNNVGKLLEIDETKCGQHLPIIMLNPLLSFSRNLATQLSGLTLEKQYRITAVGMGALGSQVFLNLIRMSYGEWVVIDKDFLLPHNLGRHGLTGISVGYPKAAHLALTANFLMPDDSPVAEAIVGDVLKPEDPEKIKSTLASAEVILDASTSIAVARHLTHEIESPARRISLFLNPLGTDVVVLAEDKKREKKLDLLEMQYYRYLINEPTLENHLRQNEGRIRYANSCRDISSTIPQDLIALHSAVCSRAIPKIISTDEATITIWHIDGDEVNVQKYSPSVADPIVLKMGEWFLCTDQWCIDKIYHARAAKLPNETGGILIGSYDMQRKIVYVVDTLLSPPDSKEWPTVYIRGFQGLKQDLTRVREITAGNLQYVGEWHSHPRGYGCKPSKDDCQAFSWLADIMGGDGLPPLMLIVGDHSQYSFYLGQMGTI